MPPISGCGLSNKNKHSYVIL